ncbi:hypothetical protein VNO77_36816 [Canavalia gladiata]|uniref:Transmembrane protein n=1 Tax=Canavalia gladiata TaxID=3824 RepID=A0AAN9KAU6_CANGL
MKAKSGLNKGIPDSFFFNGSNMTCLHLKAEFHFHTLGIFMSTHLHRFWIVALPAHYTVILAGVLFREGDPPLNGFSLEILPNVVVEDDEDEDDDRVDAVN